MLNILKHIPGFRSGKKIKMFIASICYILSLLMFTEGLGTGLFFLATPLLVFSFIDIFKRKKRSIPLSKALLSFIISFLLIIVAIAAMPNVELADASNNDSLPIVGVTQKPTDEPAQTLEPTIEETDKPAEKPTENPTEEPNEAPTEMPTEEPTEMPTVEPTIMPTVEPTAVPTKIDSKFEVHFIDVGQADASLVICDGESMLIDGGTSKSSSLIYTYLKNQGIEHLDYIVSKSSPYLCVISSATFL